MPSSRRFKVTGLAIALTICIIYYLSNGASSTESSPFYTRTLQALNDKQAEQARADVIAEEQARLERVERLQKEHDAAIANAAPNDAATPAADAAQKQQPIVQDAAGKADSGDKSVAGRKMMKGDKIVYERPEKDENDGVAKVGNVEPKSSHTAVQEGESDEEHKVEVALNDILKKGPIIIFSKSYCPFSKKAKVGHIDHFPSHIMRSFTDNPPQHILLDLYDISPPPYVVELDQHELGAGLQNKLEKTTGRRTVPNILINGKSIGGGDDVQELHSEDKIVEKITSMGGRRIVKVEKKAEETHHEVKRSEVRFKA